MYAPETIHDVAVEFHVRSELPPPAETQSKQVYDKLEVLSKQGAFAGLEKETWPSRTPVESPAGNLRETYLTYKQWAQQHGYSLSPYFQTRECYTPAEDDWEDWLVLPAMCLTVYKQESVTAVYPYTDGEETYTVQDGVGTLEETFLEEKEQSTLIAD